MLIKKIDYANIVPDRYAITDQGVILDLVRQKPVSYSVDKDGYYRVDLKTTDGKNRRFGVHRLVALHFCENNKPDIQNTVNHLNGEKKFNFASNLDWTTSADNTRHADRNNLRNVVGSANGNSRFTEDFVRAICDEYEKGLQPIDVFRVFYPDTTVDGYDERILYRLLYALKKKRIWGSVTKDYTYSTDIPFTNNKVFKPRAARSAYTEDDVRLICEKLEAGMEPNDVVDEVMHTPGCGFAEQNYDRDRVVDIVRSIAKGRLWKSISKDYDIENGIKSRIPYEDYVKIFDAEMEIGGDPHKIPTRVASKYNRNRGVVRQYFRRYLIEKGIIDEMADDYMPLSEKTVGC